MRLKNFGPLPSMRNPPDTSSGAQSLDGGPSDGEPAFPRPCKLIQTPGFSTRHSHDAEFAPPRRRRAGGASAASPLALELARAVGTISLSSALCCSVLRKPVWG